MQMIDSSQAYINAHPADEERSALDEVLNEPCSPVCVDFGEFGRRTPASIEKALYGNKPCVTFEVHLERGSSRFTSSWLTY